MGLDLSVLNSTDWLLGAAEVVSWNSIVDFITSNPVLGYPIWVVGISVVAFLFYGWDKHQAKNDGWRVPEKRLHALAFLGGWPGAMLGQQFFRHKTQKTDFKIANWLAAGLHAALVVWYLYSRLTG